MYVPISFLYLIKYVQHCRLFCEGTVAGTIVQTSSAVFCVTPSKAGKRRISFKCRHVEDHPILYSLTLLVPKTLPTGTKLVLFVIKNNLIKCMSLCRGQNEKESKHKHYILV